MQPALGGPVESPVTPAAAATLPVGKDCWRWKAGLKKASPEMPWALGAAGLVWNLGHSPLATREFAATSHMHSPGMKCVRTGESVVVLCVPVSGQCPALAAG